MKLKKLIVPAVALLIFSFSLQSCIGSFSLTNKVISWNKNVSNKFVNELVFFAFWVLPVYEVTLAADLLVINSIEFWSGNKPLEANNQVIDTEAGRYYIAADDSGYRITSPDGSVICFNHDAKSDSWSFSKNDSQPTEFLKFNGAGGVQILNVDGNFVDVELTREGVDIFKYNIGVPMFAMN